MRVSIFGAAVAAGLVLSCAERGDEATAQADSLSGADPRRRATASLVVGGDHACILARTGVKCWGRNTNGQATPPALRNPRQVFAGANHTCALDEDGVKCWGLNTSGQTTVPPLRGPKQLSGGGSHTCAIDDDGVKCWGLNGNGQTTVPALRNPSQVGAGGTHTCALDEDGVKCWGRNTNGQATVPALRSPTQITVGTTHTCALDADGVKCWGLSSSGQTTVPALVRPREVVAGGSHTCALDDSGVKCWGLAGSGQTTPPAMRRPSQLRVGRAHSCALDDEEIKCWGSNLSMQTAVPTDIELVGRHACLLANGGLRCIGDNERGQLGISNDEDRPVAMTAAAVTNLGEGFETPSQMAIGRAFGCALSRGGAVKCWGYNAYGQLGLGDGRDRGVAPGEMGDGLPELQFGGRGPMSRVAVGENHACAVSRQGNVFCWGKGSSGQLGTEATDDVGTASGPALAHMKPGLVFRDVALGRAHSCAVTIEGAVYCFGNNDAGQLGIGRAGAIGDRPGTMGETMQPVMLGDGFKVKSIVSGSRHVCALSLDARIKCWGAGSAGELGLGEAIDRGVSAEQLGAALPTVDLGHGQVVTELACGGRHCCARTIQNTMKCWGDNSEGQLGLGDLDARGKVAGSMGDSLSFVLTPPHEAVRSLQLDADRTCARTDSGVRCWGRNRAGELGYGDRESRGGTLTTVPRLLSALGI